jgi:hypothetical protein
MEKTVPLLVYDAVLLDIDGTLVDSNAAHAAAWSDAFAAHGRHHPPEQVGPLIGKGGDKLLRELASLDDESGEGKRIAEARERFLVHRSVAAPFAEEAARRASTLRIGCGLETDVQVDDTWTLTVMLRPSGKPRRVCRLASSHELFGARPDSGRVQPDQERRRPASGAPTNSPASTSCLQPDSTRSRWPSGSWSSTATARSGS